MSAYAESWPPTAELTELLIPSAVDVLVHLDLHPGNALRAGDGWKVIDPHGARADRNAADLPGGAGAAERPCGREAQRAPPARALFASGGARR
jgi:hypothetical protein